MDLQKWYNLLLLKGQPLAGGQNNPNLENENTPNNRLHHLINQWL